MPPTIHTQISNSQSGCAVMEVDVTTVVLWWWLCDNDRGDDRC
ncbi:hypothetical protein HanXRQr2_Chr03g0124381 [Helianthus annuus]|uniref:Uncharacterized protein n=1 Tax=Helianthus annuus TaxID=4232 RepID=A0A9K3NXD3_HELAN|nr:hypothetical protein HanXRQr2_Chr03g0124381 [Helianthus annuus]